MNTQELKPVMARLVGAYPSAQSDEATAVVWSEALRNVPQHVALRAARDWISDQRWFPTPAEFLARCQELNREQTGMRTTPPDCRCDGNKWVEMKHADGTYYRPTIAMPCEGCNPETHRRWAEGHFVRGHSCQECADIKRGRWPGAST